MPRVGDQGNSRVEIPLGSKRHFLDDSFVNPDRTEPATARRRMEVRQSGGVPRSALAPAVATISAVLVWLCLEGPVLVRTCGQFLRQRFEHFSTGEPTSLSRLAQGSWSEGLSPVVAVGGRGLLICFVAALVGCLSCGGWVWSPQFAAPQWSRILPTSGLSRIFSGGTITRVIGWNLVVLALVLAGIWTTFQDGAAWTVGVRVPPERFAEWCRDVLQSGGIRWGVCLFVMAALEIVVRRRQWENQLAMTPDERLREQKSKEMNPEVKRRLRRRKST